MDVRQLIDRAAVALSSSTALLYLLIGTNIVSVGEISAEEQRAFGIPAALVFAVGALVAMRWDKRWLWIVGAVGLGLIILMYFSVAPQRQPHYETWGILIRFVQIPLLASLIYLAATSQRAEH